MGIEDCRGAGEWEEDEWATGEVYLGIRDWHWTVEILGWEL